MIGPLAAVLKRLDATDEDAAEVLRTMPWADRDPELWELLKRSREVLTSGLANRSDVHEPHPPMPSAPGLFPVHVILSSLDAIRECHREFLVPDDISWETLAHAGRAMALYRTTHGEAGIRLTQWDWLRFFGWLYQVGRLTVTRYRLCTHPKEAGPLFWYEDDEAARLGLRFRRGDPALGIHIPAEGSLTPEACDEALGRLTKLRNVYPGDRVRVATCTGWMMDDQLLEYLPADSNIVRFQQRFQLVPGARDDDEAMLRVVAGTDTALQRAVMEHLERGRHWRMRTGWLAV